MRNLPLFLIHSVLYISFVSAQDARSVLPVSIKNKTSLKYNRNTIEPQYSEMLRKHIDKTYQKYQSDEKIRGFVKRGLNVGRNSMSFLSLAVGPNLLKEVVFETADFALDQQSKNNLEDFNYNVENLAKAIIASNQKLEITSEKFKNEVKSMFFDTGINPEHYPVLGRQFDKMIFDRLIESKENLEKFRSSVGKRITELENKGKTRDAAILEIQNSLAGKDVEIVSLKSSQAGLKNSLDRLELDIHKRMNSFVQSTIEWRERVNQDMDEISNKVNVNDQRIKQNEQKIESLQKELNTASLAIEEHSKKIENLQNLQSENRNLILSNRVRLDALSSVMYGEASVSGKINMLKNGLVKFDNKKELDEEITKLENIQSWEEFNKNLADGKEIVKFAGNLGLDSKTVSEANKALSAISLVGQFAISYPSNPIGMISAVNGAFSLFGNEKKNNANAAILKELAAIRQQLSAIEDKVIILNQKADEILERQYRFHIQNVRSFASLHESIDRLRLGQNRIMQLLLSDCAVLQPDDYSDLKDIMERLRSPNLKIKDYNKLLDAYNNLLPEVLRCVDKNTQSLSLSSVKFINMEKIRPNVVENQFIPLLIYAKSIYQSNLIRGLTYLPRNTNSIWQYVGLISDLDLKDSTLKDLDPFAFMINSYDLSQLVDLYILVMPYFLLEEDSDTSTYNIWKERKLEKVDPFILTVRTNTQLKTFRRLLKLVEIGIAHESLLAGNKLFQHLEDHLGKTSSLKKELAFNAIKNNQIIQLNLSTYLLNKHILRDFNSKKEFLQFFDNSKKNKITSENINKWNSQLKNNWIFHQREETDGYSLWIKTTLEINGSEQNLNLPIDLQSSLSNEMIYSDESNMLLTAQEKIKDKILEYEFQSFINKNREKEFAKNFNALFTEIKTK